MLTVFEELLLFKPIIGQCDFCMKYDTTIPRGRQKYGYDSAKGRMHDPSGFTGPLVGIIQFLEVCL